MATREGTLLRKIFRIETELGERYFKTLKYDVTNFRFDIEYLDNHDLSTITWDILIKDCIQVGG